MQGDIITNGRGGIFGYDTVIDVSRPNTHDGAGHIKATALQACARTKYTKHSASTIADTKHLGSDYVSNKKSSLGIG